VWRTLTFGNHGVRAFLAEPFAAALLRHGVGPVSRRVLEALLWQLLLRDARECSLLEAGVALAPLARGAVALTGGVEGLAEALRARFGADGGCLRLGTEISRLLVERGRVSGVVTKGGETIRAGRVVAAVSPLGLESLLPVPGRWRKRPTRGSSEPTHVAQMLLVTVAEAYLPSELGEHCLVVPDAARAATEDNMALLHVGRPAPGDDLRAVTVSRFVRTPAERPFEPALLTVLDEVIPGAWEVARHREPLSPAEMGAHWGRPQAAVRYGPEAREWLGQRGMPPRPGWPGLWAVGEWIFPGRQVPAVVAGAMRVADRLVEEL
jgi:phytoene dehydrogenase-like protein